MPKFVATTSRGLVDVLEEELKELGVKVTDKGPSSVDFEGSWAACYRINLCSRIASRILYSVLDFTAYNQDEFYNNFKKHDFTKYIDVDQTMLVEASVKNCCFKDQRLLAMKTKDAVVDQFWAKYDRRPDVDHESAALRVYVRGNKNNYNVSIDTTGESLFKRGYRSDPTEAPLKEHIAAGILAIAGYKGDVSVVDPMCGSGTILIEAALWARQIAPGTMRKKFVCQKLKNFQADAWDEEVNKAIEQEVTELPVKFYGFDINGRAVRAAKANAKAAGVEDMIEFVRRDVVEFTPPCPRGLIVTNPPYGVRIGGDEYELQDTYKNLAHSLKANFKGWTAWILAGNKELTPALRLKASGRFQVFNGPIECRFLKYELK